MTNPSFDSLVGAKIVRFIPDRSGGVSGIVLDNGCVIRAVSMRRNDYGHLEWTKTYPETGGWPQNKEAHIDEYCNGFDEDKYGPGACCGSG